MSCSSPRFRRHFNPRSPHGERPSRRRSQGCWRRAISIHAPRTGSDTPLSSQRLTRRKAFQSTLPARGATVVLSILAFGILVISIHAPRTGSDDAGRPREPIGFHFNPRSPHGERQKAKPEPAQLNPISIHAPRTGSDARDGRACTGGYAFQSTLPARGATILIRRQPSTQAFQSTLPARGATSSCVYPLVSILISIHAPRTGSDAIAGSVYGKALAFQSTLPARGATKRRNR